MNIYTHKHTLVEVDKDRAPKTRLPIARTIINNYNMKEILLIISILFISTIAYSQDADKYSDMADAKIEQGDFQYAMVLIEKAIALNETNQWFYLKKAEIQFKLSGPLDAIQILQQAILLNPEKPEPYNRVGSYYESAGITDSAIIMYNLAINHSENDTAKYAYIMNRGAAKAGRRDFKEALKDYEAVLKFDPKNIGALNNIASVYRQLGMTDKGIASLKTIISIDGSFIGPYVNLGFIYSKLDSLDLAIEYFGRALLIDPNEALVYSNRGHTYYKKGDYRKALADINLSITLYPTNSYAYRNLALVYIAMDSIKEACTALDYAKSYGFEKRYGSEVKELLNEHCKK
ncbi:tetratricopeptide repeat protein [Candidatus Amoebophilus asiaticus]|nr:tetratricopeptide repeat protein [Candidatus Amoebophilus asiaticus]